jgi:hypothetical protein
MDKTDTNDNLAQVQQVADETINQVQAQAKQFAGTVQDVAKDPTKVIGLVGDQVKNF